MTTPATVVKPAYFTVYSIYILVHIVSENMKGLLSVLIFSLTFRCSLTIKRSFASSTHAS